jgi:hypothetical protein
VAVYQQLTCKIEATKDQQLLKKIQLLNQLQHMDGTGQYGI